METLSLGNEGFRKTHEGTAKSSPGIAGVCLVAGAWTQGDKCAGTYLIDARGVHHERLPHVIAGCVNTHAALLEALKDAQAVIHLLATEGRFFDDRDKGQGLEGKINAAVSLAEGAI